MKQKIYLIIALVLLLAAAGYMVSDLFFTKPDSSNPYDFGMDSLRNADTSIVSWKESHSYTVSFIRPHGIALDREGKLYIAGKDTLEILSLDGTYHEMITVPGEAWCIHVDTEGRIYLGMEEEIRVLAPGGSKSESWKTEKGSLFTSIASSGEDIMAADYGKKIVNRFNRKGKLLSRLGQKDPALGIPGFIIPSPYFDLAFDGNGFLWVVNPGLHQFEKYDKEGHLISKWKRSSIDISGFCGCCNPSHMAFFNDSVFVTSEKAIERIKTYDLSGNLLSVVALPESFDEGTKGLDLAVAEGGKILVLDPGRRQVRVFEEKNKP